jgi:hypothetical protein
VPEDYDEKLKRLWESYYGRHLSWPEFREVEARFEAWIDLALSQLLPLGESDGKNKQT